MKSKFFCGFVWIHSEAKGFAEIRYNHMQISALDGSRYGGVCQEINRNCIQKHNKLHREGRNKRSDDGGHDNGWILGKT